MTSSFDSSIDILPPLPLTGPGSERPPKKQKGTSGCAAPVESKAQAPGALGASQNQLEGASPPGKADNAAAVFYKIAALPSGDDNHGDPRDSLQQALELVAENLREDPTLPCDPLDSQRGDPDALREDAAIELPPKHCAFVGCARSFASGAQLSQHLATDPCHSKILAAVTRCMAPSRDSIEVRRFSAYCEAIAWKVRQGAPLDTYSIDRRAVLQYNTATADDQVYMPMCFSCARRFPHIASLDKEGRKPKNEIRWQKPVQSEEGGTFFGMGFQRCADIFGLDIYVERYGHLPGFPDMRQRMAEFEDWQLLVPFLQRPLTILCCPEDRRCTSENSKSCMATRTLCTDCEVGSPAEGPGGWLLAEGPGGGARTVLGLRRFRCGARAGGARRGAWGHLLRLYKAPTDFTKPQKEHTKTYNI